MKNFVLSAILGTLVGVLASNIITQPKQALAQGFASTRIFVNGKEVTPQNNEIYFQFDPKLITFVDGNRVFITLR
jgi:hypothetical protein